MLNLKRLRLSQIQSRLVELRAFESEVIDSSISLITQLRFEDALNKLSRVNQVIVPKGFEGRVVQLMQAAGTLKDYYLSQLLAGQIRVDKRDFLIYRQIQV